MKLRNKKTGEIVSLQGELTYDDKVRLLTHYNSLAELNEEWEDAPEEPKPWWYIDITLVVKQGELFLSKHVEQFKTVGNYFNTREEAEKAVKKLKAWKRLKDKGFKFDGYDVAHNSNGNLAGQIFYDAGNYSIEDVEKEMDLLFGGEE